jgi:O-antigen/teichoic acid export membrane protein
MPGGQNPELPKVARVAKEAARGSLHIFVGNTSSTAILAIASIIVARLLGPSNYGLYSVALIAPSLMLLFTDFGVDSALVRFTAKLRSVGKSGSIGSFVGAGLLFRLAMSFLMFLLTFLFADEFATHLLKRPEAGSLIRLASIVIVGGMLVGTASSVFNGLDKMDKTALLSVIQASVKAVSAPILIVVGLSVFGALAGHVLGYVVAGVVGAIMIARMSKLPRFSLNEDQGIIQSLTPMIRYGIPLYASALIASLLGQYQSLNLAWFTSNMEIGNYYVATVFSAAIAILTTPISTALFPAFSKLDPDSETRDLQSLFTNTLKYTLLLVIPASIFIAVSSRELVSVFYGSSYVEAPLYLTLYSTTFIYTGFSLVLGSFFNGIGRTDISLKATLIQLPAVLLLTPVLTWLYRVPGFIAALIISGAPPLAYLALTAHSKYGLKFNLDGIVRICAAGLISSTPILAIASYLPSSHLVKLMLSAATFLLAYLILAPLIGAIKPEDINNLNLITEDIKPISKLSKIALSFEKRILSLTS